MTVKEPIEMLETCDKESIVYINCGWEGLGFVLQWAKYGLKK